MGIKSWIYYLNLVAKLMTGDKAYLYQPVSSCEDRSTQPSQALF